MAKRLRVVFKKVNGDNTGYYTRQGPGKTYPTDGIHFMRNCSDGKTFYCEPESAGNGYYKLIDPASNGITVSAGKECGSHVAGWIHKALKTVIPKGVEKL